MTATAIFAGSGSPALAWVSEGAYRDPALWVVPVLLGACIGLAVCLVVQKRRLRQVAHSSRARDFALQERQKELRTLGRIIQLTSNIELSLPELVRIVADELPPGFTYPDDLAVRITIDGLVTDWREPSRIVSRLEVPIEAGGQQIGTILVGYLHDQPKLEDGPFWQGERQLLLIVAQRLASIDARKSASAMLEQSEVRFRAIFESNALPSAVDDGGTFFNMNLAALQSLGINDKSEMIGRTPMDFSPEFQPDGRLSAQVVAEVIKNVAEVGSSRFDWVFRRADGKEFLADVTLSRIPWGQGTITLSVWTDVTALRDAAATVAQYNEKLVTEVALQTADLAKLNRELTTILATATSGVALVRDMIVLRCNPALCHIFGTAEDKIIGTSFASLCDDEAMWRACSIQARQTLSGGETFSVEHELRRPDGSLFWARMRARSIDPAQPEIGSVWVVDDISVEVAARAKMAEARRAAEEAVEVKARFLANMSHEIRTPLNAVLGFAAILKDSGMTAHQMSFLDKITAAGMHLLMVINDILDFSKVEAGKVAIEEVDLSLNDTVHSAVDMVLSRATEKNIEVIVDIDPALPDAYRGDPLRISQVLVNLLSNAVKFTNQGEIVVAISGEPAPDGREALRFSVSDTGIGMSQDQISQLFQSFVQVDASTTRLHGGTGLGLAISRGLAELMGGQLSVESTPNKGSTFQMELTLPRRPEETPQQSPLSGKRVLIVESNLGALAATARAMTGAVVTIAGSTAAALAQLRDDQTEGAQFDIALIDHPMPDAEHLVARLGTACHIILMTIDDGTPVDPLPQGGGKPDVLRKPFNPRDLHRIMSQRGQGSQAAHVAPVEQTKRLKGCRILVVDDNPLNQEVAFSLLRQRGADVSVAENGALAVQAVQDQPFDLVLMDIQMPVMDGIEATRAIRALDGSMANVPIIAVTASVESDAKGYALQAGMNDIVIKPFLPAALEQLVLRWTAPAIAAPAGVAPSHDHNGSPIPQDIASLGVVDAEEGLALAGGSEALYRSLLRRFVSDQAHFTTNFQAARSVAEPRGAERLAHTLKSSAAQIGAHDLAKVAARLETAARIGDQDAIDAQLAPLSERLAVVRHALATLEELPAASSAPDVSAPFDEAAEQIATLLERGEFAALNAFEEARSTLQAGFAPADWADFCKSLDAFDLPAALALLRHQLDQRHRQT